MGRMPLGKDYQGGYNSSNNSDAESYDDEPGTNKRQRKSGGGGGDEDLGDRKEKHKVVEQKRREKTKELLTELQDLLPNTDESTSANLTMNTVLQCAIDFLTSRATHGVTGDDASGDDTSGTNDIDVAYRSGFMMASMGIAYTGVDGTILEVNPAFATMLGFGADQRHKLIGRTLFSLITPQDIQSTLKAVSRLLSGEIAHSLLIKNCYRQDGNAGFFRMEMNCMWKANKAHCFVCFIRPADESASRPAGQLDGAMAGMGGPAVGMGMGGGMTFKTEN
uniref:BHLH domain-containing protein n=1 Tax=Hemiselmis tepida TaxID=464990 RepID=A0A7S0W881_9CRYP|mmetsp:Transcript_8450/g.21930  ORF Transcript_8450/g.21930 Transcript_8450/m.21930 type:complete len:278 (+) Transcript_8450:100-933(+)